MDRVAIIFFEEVIFGLTVKFQEPFHIISKSLYTVPSLRLCHRIIRTCFKNMASYFFPIFCQLDKLKFSFEDSNLSPGSYLGIVFSLDCFRHGILGPQRHPLIGNQFFRHPSILLLSIYLYHTKIICK